MLELAIILALCGAVSSFFKDGWFVLVASYILFIAATIAFVVKGDYWLIARFFVGLVSFQASYVVVGLSYGILLSRRKSQSDLLEKYLKALGDRPGDR